MQHPRRSRNAGWPRYTPPSCILGCVHHVLSIQPITLQDPHRKGRALGSSQRARALDWSRHNYHVNILLRIRWYDTHTHSLGACFPHQSRGTRTLWWVFFRADKETEEGVEKGGTGIEELSACCCTVIYPISAVVTPQTEKSEQWR